MNLTRGLTVALLLSSTSAWAIYAPIPEQNQGKAWTVSLRAGIQHDSNIFGAPSGAIASTIYTVAPKAEFNASVTAQTFFSASYQLTLDHFDNRPGDKTVDSHDLMLRVAHAFTPDRTLDVTNVFTAQKNPEALLPGVATANPTVANSDQSFKRNETDARFSTSLSPKLGLTVKARSVIYRYDNARLGTNLDRLENLYGLSADYAVLPETKAVAEYRHQSIDYRNSGDTKDKSSDFGLIGADYAIAKKVSTSARLGFEFRRRESERSTTAPYAELSGKYDYAQGSFLTAGYMYTLEESSNVAVYTDTRVNRFFVNVQHAVSARIAASGSLSFEPSTLQGRRGQADIDETAIRAGVALAYLPTKNWTVSGTYDHDRFI
jgi:predicted porin